MGNSILRGISTALIVTVITLVAGMFWTSMGLGGLTMSTLVDIGLIASCVAAGFRAGRESGQWILGGFASLGYVTLCIVLLALFLKVSGWGAIQVLAEGGLIGMVAGALGAGSGAGKKRTAGSWRYEWDSHLTDWDDREALDEFQSRKSRNHESKRSEEGQISWDSSFDAQSMSETSFGKENIQWFDRSSLTELKGRSSYREDNPDQKEDEWISREDNRGWKEDKWVSKEDNQNWQEDEWESWVCEEKKKQTSTRNAWWEEDVL